MRYRWSDNYAPNLVSDWGPLSSPILGIGEAPGESEDTYEFDARTHKLLSVVDKNGNIIQQPKNRKTVHYPFVGRAGQILDHWMHVAGLKREQIRLTNVVPFRPENNKFNAFPKEFVADWVEVLHTKIAQMTNLCVIVPMGNHALEALLDETGITNWRGSILPYTALDGRTIKVIPALHPAGFFHQPAISYWAMYDWQRIVEEAKTPEFILSPDAPIVNILPSLEDIQNWYQHWQEWDCKTSVDIENHPETHLITCIGFACMHGALSIPLEDGEYWANGKLNQAWDLVRLILMLPNSKVLQNGFHDAFYLFRRKNISINGWVSDTLAKSHCLVPTAPTSLKPHSLGNQASIYLKTRFWKHDAQKE